MRGTPDTAPRDAMPAQGPEPALDLDQLTGSMVVHLVVDTKDLVPTVEEMAAITEERIPMLPDLRRRSPRRTPRMMNRQSRVAGTTQILF